MVNAEEKNYSVFKDYAQGMSFIGTVGVEDEVTENTKESIQALHSAGIKLCLTSGDSCHSCVSTGYKSGLIK